MTTSAAGLFPLILRRQNKTIKAPGLSPRACFYFQRFTMSPS
nr:MAG TPA: hypothetical protein [Bacteriophage sp.]